MLDVLVSASDSNSDSGVIVMAGPNPGDKSLFCSLVTWVTLVDVTEGYWKDTSDPFLAGGDPNLILVQDCLLGLPEPGPCPADLDLISAANPSSLLESLF